MTEASRSGIVALGSGEVTPICRALGLVQVADPGRAPARRRAWLVWGPIDHVHELRPHVRGERVVWRVAGLDVPLAARDDRLLAGIDRIVVGDPATRAFLGAHDARCEVIEPLSIVAQRRSPPDGEIPPVPTVIFAVDPYTVASTLVPLKQLLDGGIHRCGSCGRAATAAFDPSSVAFAAPAGCPCGGPIVALTSPTARWVVALRGDEDAGATAMSEWLGIADRVVVTAEADLEVDSSDLVVDASTGVDPGWGAWLSAATGARCIAAAVHRGAVDALVGTRTESSPDGRVCHTIDPVDLHRVLTHHLATPSGCRREGQSSQRAAAWSTDAVILDRWARLLDSVVSMGPRRVPARRLRSLASNRSRT